MLDLGLIGLITAELLLANGCNVIGFDFDPEKIRIAKEKGIIAINPGEGTDQVKFVESYTNGVGADGVIITASNKSNEIISQSANMCRKRGRIILVGVIGLDISRADFFEKKLHFKFLVLMVQEDMMKNTNKKDMIIQLDMLDGQKNEILKQF